MEFRNNSPIFKYIDFNFGNMPISTKIAQIPIATIPYSSTISFIYTPPVTTRSILASAPTKILPVINIIIMPPYSDIISSIKPPIESHWNKSIGTVVQKPTYLTVVFPLPVPWDKAYKSQKSLKNPH